MLKNDEELRGPSRRIKGHIEDKEYLGWGVCVVALWIHVVGS
jgi:hypothetical protein